VLSGKSALYTPDLAAELLQRTLVGGDVDVVALLDHLDEVLHHALVKVLAAKVGISTGREHLDDAIFDGKESDIEGPASEIEDEDVLLATLLMLFSHFTAISYSQNSFTDYVMGRKQAPVLTIFVCGNHEASNILRELYYGGWVAPNIYFLGSAGVVRYSGFRIAVVSGIFHDRHYRLGLFETPPFTKDSMRSVYHLRELEVFRLAQLASYCSVDANPIDVFLSHDWPSVIWDHGYVDQLLRKKGFLQEDVASEKLGSPPLMNCFVLVDMHVNVSSLYQLLSLLRPALLELDELGREIRMSRVLSNFSAPVPVSNPSFKVSRPSRHTVRIGKMNSIVIYAHIHIYSHYCSGSVM
jgi:lariat debranching enzyme